MFIENERSGIDADLHQIDVLQKEFDNVLGVQKKTGKIRSYNIVLSRWHFIETPHDKTKNFKINEEWEIKTFLEERFGIPKEPVNFITNENGIVYSELLPNEPFNTVLQRGIEYRKQEGSVEQERERAELVGWLEIQKVLLDPKTKLGSQMAVVSGTGIVTGTSYPNNYIDLYESFMDFKSGRRGIVRKRFISDLSYEDYKSEVEKYKSDYFKNLEGPLDAWFLANPVLANPDNPRKLFQNIFREKKSEIKAEEFEEIFVACMPLITNYINILCSDEFDPENLAIAFNAVINKADAEKHKKTNKTFPHIVFRSINEEALWFGRQRVVDILAGCGLSSGYKIGMEDKIFNLLGNSVAQFGIEDDGKYDEIKECTHCPFCKETVRAGIKNGRIYCLSCHESAPYQKTNAA